MAAPKTGRVDFRQRLTNALIEAMEEQAGMPWEQGWDNAAARPFNPGTGIKYRGGNVINLLMEQIERGSDDPRWMTLKQANDAGYSIRKGAHSAYVEYWDWGQQEKVARKPELDEHGNPIIREEDVEDESPEVQERRKPKVFFATVFNGVDIVGLPELKREITWQPNEVAEKLIAATGARIDHAVVSKAGGGVLDNAAYYSHGKDRIVLPPREQFRSDGDFYATVLHELAHWTGHQSRLSRRAPDEARPFGSPEYAKEELRAEIAALFLTSMLGVDGNVQNHAKYTGHWLEQLKGDKHEIFRAARDAEKIVDHLFEYAPELREVVDTRLSDNLLPKERPQRKLDSGVTPGLPSFIPPDAPPPAPRTGRDDPRWSGFDKTLRTQAERFGVGGEVVDRALLLVEPQFTEVMDAAKRNGYSADDMYAMLSRRMVDEMRTADVRQQQWQKFCDQVRDAADGVCSGEQVEASLQQLGERYQEVIAQSGRDGWSKEQTDAAIHAAVYGDEGRRPISSEYVKAFVAKYPGRMIVVQQTLDEDDFVLTPMGMGDVDDAGAIADGRIHGADRHFEDAESSNAL